MIGKLDSPPEGPKCARHPERPATWVCSRCGSFACVACANQVRPEAPPMCPDCWQRRTELVAGFSTPADTTLQTAAVVLGVFALLPFWPVQVLSLGIGIAAVRQARKPPYSRARTRAWVGLVLTLVGITLEVGLLVLSAVADR